MIKKQTNEVTDISAKGVLNEITTEGFLIYDEKNDIEELLTFDELKLFEGKTVNLKFTTKEEKE